MSADRNGQSGFTIIEMLVVMAITLTLVGLLAFGLAGAREKAANKATKAIVQKVKVALEAYHGEFRDYPPDGYDMVENPGWDVTAQGVLVGYGADARRVKGTSALIYFLCRPLIKVSRLGAGVNTETVADPRFVVRKRVGPFLDLAPNEVTMDTVQVTCAQCGGAQVGFEAAHPWTHGGYWNTATGGFINNEIADAYRHPLCYDKVKTEVPGDYWQPDRFQGTGAGKGRLAHQDQVFIGGSGGFLVQEQDEPEGYSGATFNQMVNARCDPRYINKVDMDNLQPLFDAGGQPPAATNATHEPKYTTGYDLWSAGRSWIDPRDDITSWGE